jgi:hypothetical protein
MANASWSRASWIAEAGGDVGREFAGAAAEVLHERVTGGLWVLELGHGC